MRVRCSACGKTFEGQRSTAKFCGSTCRKRGSRDVPGTGAKPQEMASVLPIPAKNPPEKLQEPALVTVTRRELEAAGKLDTVVGQQAMRLAEKLTSSFDTGSAAAAVSKELSRVMAEALADVTKQDDALDELMQRRMQKASGA